jgi:DNA invertase Pin-like site-specific DNA recombinase
MNVREFCDLGPAHTASEDRPAFEEMVKDWIVNRSDFDCVLCFDLPRLGRGGDERKRFVRNCL